MGGNQNMSLFSVYWRYILQYTEDKHTDISECGCFKLVIVKHYYVTGPHLYTVYQRQILEEFHQWYQILFNQPPHSTFTNVQGVYLLTMWSNNVLRSQALSFGIQLMTVQRLYVTAKNVFWGDKCHTAMSWDYSGHHKIPYTIIKLKGEDNHLTEREGEIFGV